jgi:hypothetical protein
VPKYTPAEKREKAKLDAANARRRERREAQRKEAAEQLKLEHFVEIAASGAMVSDPSGKSPKQMLKARETVMAAFEKLGGLDALVKFGQMYPKEFYTQIWSKILPRQMEAEVGENLEELLRELGQGKVPGMHEARYIEAEYTEITPEDRAALGDTIQ